MEGQLNERRAFVCNESPLADRWHQRINNEVVNRKRKTIRCVFPFDSESETQENDIFPQLIRRQYRKTMATDAEEDSMLEDNFKRCVAIEDKHDLNLLKNCIDDDNWLEVLADVWDAFPMPPESEIMKLSPIASIMTSIAFFEQ